MKRQKPEIGALFTVPLPDNRGVVAQVVGREADALNSWTCAFSSVVVNPEKPEFKGSLTPNDVISVLFTSGDLLKNGTWRIFSSAPVIIDKSDFPNEEFRRNRWIGAKIYGSQIVNSFIAAYFGQGLWDEMKDPDYYRKLLLTRIAIPYGIKKKNGG